VFCDEESYWLMSSSQPATAHNRGYGEQAGGRGKRSQASPWQVTPLCRCRVSQTSESARTLSEYPQRIPKNNNSSWKLSHLYRLSSPFSRLLDGRVSGCLCYQRLTNPSLGRSVHHHPRHQRTKYPTPPAFLYV